MSALDNLERLFLDGNQLVGCIPDGLRNVRDADPTNDPDNDIADLDLPDCRGGDEDALRALFEATDGHNWKRSTNWMSDNPVGDWYGVTVAANGRVKGLDLASNGLKGTIPPEIGSLRYLQELHLSKNQLTGSLPTRDGRLGEPP